jgi:hypothetical protein
VDEEAERDRLQLEAVARTRLRTFAGHDRLADLQLARRDDVALLAVSVEEQRDAGRAVRVVLDGVDDGGDAVLVALEVDETEAALVPAAVVARRDVAVRVARAGLPDAREQRTLGRAFVISAKSETEEFLRPADVGCGP